MPNDQRKKPRIWLKVEWTFAIQQRWFWPIMIGCVVTDIWKKKCLIYCIKKNSLDHLKLVTDNFKADEYQPYQYQYENTTHVYIFLILVSKGYLKKTETKTEKKKLINMTMLKCKPSVFL